MPRLPAALTIGVLAGVVDVLPMIAMRLDWHASLSAFAQWVALGVLIAYAQMGLAPWLKGLVVAEMMALPIMILVSMGRPLDPVPIAVMSAVLGSLVGWASARWAAPLNDERRA
jgi:hypothetical protein